jgi:hypothetical protein
VTAAPSPQQQQLIDLQQLMVSMRQRRRACLVAGLLGLLAGVLVAVLVPAKPSAVTRVLVVHETEEPGSGGSLIKTDIALLETTRIAAAALKSVNSTDRPEDFVKEYEATPLTDNVLELTVTGADDGDAMARAKALADAFIADHVQRVQAAAKADAQALIDRRTIAQQELAQVKASIAAMSEADRRNQPTQLDAFYDRQGQLDSQITDLTNRAEEAGTGAPRVAAGTQIIDDPRALPRSFVKTAVTNGAIGFVLAFAAALALSAVTSVVRERPVLRRDIMEHVGASVIAEVREPRRGLARLLSRQEGARRQVAATLGRGIGQNRGSVSLLELGAPKAAAALAVDVAKALSWESNVIIIDDLTRGRLGKRVDASDGPIRVVDGSARPAHWPQAAGRPERVLGLGSVRAGTSWTDLPRLGAETLLVVRAGYASASWLHTVARQLADLQIPIIGVVLVDADPKDRSDGTLWDGLHTALRGRIGSAAASPAAQAGPLPATGPAGPAAPDAPGEKTAPNATPDAAQTNTLAAPPRRPGGFFGAANTDDYPTEARSPSWPAAGNVQDLKNAPSQRKRRRQRLEG